MRRNHAGWVIAVFVVSAVLQGEGNEPYVKITSLGNHQYAVGYFSDAALTQPATVDEKDYKFGLAIEPVREELKKEIARTGSCVVDYPDYPEARLYKLLDHTYDLTYQWEIYNPSVFLSSREVMRAHLARRPPGMIKYDRMGLSAFLEKAAHGFQQYLQTFVADGSGTRNAVDDPSGVGYPVCYLVTPIVVKNPDPSFTVQVWYLRFDTLQDRVEGHNFVTFTLPFLEVQRVACLWQGTRTDSLGRTWHTVRLSYARDREGHLPVPTPPSLYLKRSAHFIGLVERDLYPFLLKRLFGQTNCVTDGMANMCLDWDKDRSVDLFQARLEVAMRYTPPRGKDRGFDRKSITRLWDQFRRSETRDNIFFTLQVDQSLSEAEIDADREPGYASFYLMFNPRTDTVEIYPYYNDVPRKP